MAAAFDTPTVAPSVVARERPGHRRRGSPCADVAVAVEEPAAFAEVRPALPASIARRVRAIGPAAPESFPPAWFDAAEAATFGLVPRR
jgi:hypothetical protein